MRASRRHLRFDNSINTFYLDESGNSGDLVKAGNAFDFGQQPVFVLVGVGLAEADAVAAELERLRARYRVNSPEFKSSVLKDKPGFVADLATYLGERRSPNLYRSRRQALFHLRDDGQSLRYSTSCGRIRSPA
ncbi:DUF3800 domain-containing protein [Bradyrhizobium sp. SZCCHNR3058]|uniref:DUF3800 domain-containing protein n=1 Tax=Bradyrhizobium sp. SZCCHNR3058 TaxID=3057423 RepID=UPI0029169D72|nr:DUF3800 domain-containing protein [Bradyrhizobium sp. SZCCHNR3058]